MLWTNGWNCWVAFLRAAVSFCFFFSICISDFSAVISNVCSSAFSESSSIWGRMLFLFILVQIVLQYSSLPPPQKETTQENPSNLLLTGILMPVVCLFVFYFPIEIFGLSTAFPSSIKDSLAALEVSGIFLRPIPPLPSPPILPRSYPKCGSVSLDQHFQSAQQPAIPPGKSGPFSATDEQSWGPVRWNDLPQITQRQNSEQNPGLLYYQVCAHWTILLPSVWM